MPERPTCPVAQLLHTLPDGSAHVDLLLAPAPRRCVALVTFRLPRRVDDLRPGDRLEARRIADHRRRYLVYEGPVSRNRGVVKRLARGFACWDLAAEDRLRLRVAWIDPDRDPPAEATYDLRLLGGPRWRLDLLAWSPSESSLGPKDSGISRVGAAE